MKVVFIRHGESAANAGLPCDSFDGIPLTPRGHQQAHALALAWQQTPTHILHSPFLRTCQTAAPTIARFPAVPVEAWPIHEYNNLHHGRWSTLATEDRWREERRQWQRCDPHYNDGPGSESFATLLTRATAALDRLATLPANALVYAFSHGYFMHAVRLAIQHPHLPPAERMRLFVPLYNEAPFFNTQTFTLSWDGVLWRILDTQEPEP